jgi:AAA domain/Domain of unknown function (DUF3854)
VNGKEIRYRGAQGVSNHLYFPPGWKDLLESDFPFLWTEGEFKALATHGAGMACLASSGVWSWRTRNLFNESRPLPDLDLVRWKDREVTLAFDNDVIDKEQVQKALLALAHELYRRGVGRVSALLIPHVGGAKLGIDDFLHLFGLDALLSLDTCEIPNPYPQCKVWTLAELRKAEIAAPEPIVEGWGLRRGGKMLLVGLGGAGKSIVLLQIALSLAAGAPIFGYQPLAVTRPQRVAIYIAEDDLGILKERLLAQIAALGYPPETEERILPLDFGGRRISVENEADQMVLFQALKECQADVAILDPLVSIHDSDENSNSAMRRVLDLFGPLQANGGLTIALAHHEPKGNDNADSAARGAGAIRDWSRTMLRLTKHGDSGELGGRYSLLLSKNNYGGAVKLLTLERAKDSYTYTIAEEKTAVTAIQVWETIGSGERWYADVVKELTSRFKASEATVYRAIKRAEELSLAVINPDAENPETGRKKKMIRRGEGIETSEQD